MLLVSLALAMQSPSNEITFSLDNLNVRITDGFVRSLMSNGHDYLSNAKPAPLLSIRLNGQLITPSAMQWNKRSNTARLDFSPSEVSANVRILNKHTHLTCELVSLTKKSGVEVVLWGPYPTTIRESIGETVGVVHDDQFALGIQALNAKTLGGYPNTEDDIEPSYDIFATSSVVDVSPDDSKKEQYRGDTARPTSFGSVLQAYTRDRSNERIIENWAHKHFVAPPYRDGGVVGTKIALFGCPKDKALDRLGQIELAEGLPHPILDGQWGKIAKGATESYLIIGFGEKDLDDAIALTKKAGLRYLYTDSCFETWGHFKLNAERFPDGLASMKRCVDRAGARGVRLGVHTLSNFITTTDPYVTPIPDRRLGEVGASILVESLDKSSQTVTIADPTFFNQMQNNTLRTVRVGDELIEYTSVSSHAPWQLIGCKRGAFGTAASAHRTGDRIAKLMDHGYRTFLTNAELSKEVAKNIANVFNQTGLRQLSLDGLEGNWSTGMGQYGRTIFTKEWYDNLTPSLKGQVINDASNPGHFNWHIYTRMNWGEPWYAGFRESQTQYRLMNQRYYKRNLMPAMLGWFNMSAETSIEDAEWLLARAAGFDAGFCLVTSPKLVHENGQGEAILTSMREWERARHSGAFSDSQKRRMQDIDREFHLTPTGANAWNLREVASKKTRLAGNGSTEIELHNPFDGQSLEFILQVPADAHIEQISISVDNDPTTRFTSALQGPCIVRATDAAVTVTNSHHHAIKELKAVRIQIPSGPHTLRIDSAGTGEIKAEFRLIGPIEQVTGH